MQMHVISILMHLHLNANIFSMTTEPSQQAQKTWITLMQASRHLLATVEKQLKENKLPSLEWYDILWELECDKSGHIRPQDLEKRTLLAQYQMSRVLARMEAAGLVTLTQMESDKRGRTVAITQKGRDVRAMMWRCYGTFLHAQFDSKLTPPRMTDLAALLTHLTGTPPA